MRALLNPPLATRATQRGFTLIELMVALTGGLFISIAVFALSRDTSRFYQRETRVAHATLSGVNGFERLVGDLSRAGHMATPNIGADPRVCNRPDASWPDLLENLRAIVLDTSGASATGTEVAKASIKPHAVIVSGALNTPEELHTRSVLPDGNGAFDVSINLSTPAAYRIGLRLKDPATNQVVLQNTFLAGGVGKIVRLRRMGSEQYAIVASVSTTNDTAILNLAATPQLVVRTNDDVQCGLSGSGSQMGLSVIDVVRYDIRPMINDANYVQMYAASGIGGGTSGLPYESKRAELVRVELDPAGAEIAGTREIVGEYAVDLQFGAWRNTGIGAIEADDADVFVANYGLTQQLRGLHVRLSVRSREADRELDVVGAGSGNLYRMPLELPDHTITYARVRTFQTDVPLRNLENSNW